MVVDPNEVARRRDSGTVVVCGSPRGMTSVVAYTLYELGLYLGARVGAKNYEDQDLLDLMPAASAPDHAGSLDTPAFRDAVALRDQSHERWGFKIPHAAAYVDQLEGLLRDVIFVVCLRNPVAVAQSVVNREPGMTFDAERLLEIGTRPIRTIQQLQTMNSPFIIVDMDAVRRMPGVYLEELSTQLGLKGDLASIKETISTPGYKAANERPGTTLQPQ